MKPKKGTLLDILIDVSELKVDVVKAHKKIMKLLEMGEPVVVNIKQRKPMVQREADSYMIANSKSGESFYSDKTDRHLTSIASYHGKKVKTERVVILSGSMSEPKMESKTKCIIL